MLLQVALPQNLLVKVAPVQLVQVNMFQDTRADANGNVPTREARDDSTTLKVSQLNSFVDEDMLRNELFAKFGPLQRVTIVRNRETGESRGFAYVSFATEEIAQRALDTFNGKGYHSLILHLEWSKKKKT